VTCASFRSGGRVCVVIVLGIEFHMRVGSHFGEVEKVRVGMRASD
jgi:hypothetical protein